MSYSVPPEQTPEEIAARGTTNVPANSGGVYLSSAEVVSVVMKAYRLNSGDIYIGGFGPFARPYSGYGYCLEPGDTTAVDIKNLNQIYLVSILSGEIVYWYANR